MLEEIPVGVDGRLQIVLRDRAPDRLAVDVDEHRGRLAEEDRRRIGLHALDVLRDDLARVDVGQHAVERDHALVERASTSSISADDLRDLIRCKRREVGLGNLQLREAHQPLVERHLGVGFHLDGAERRLVGPVARYDTALNATMCFRLSQLATCG